MDNFVVIVVFLCKILTQVNCECSGDLCSENIPNVQSFDGDALEDPLIMANESESEVKTLKADNFHEFSHLFSTCGNQIIAIAMPVIMGDKDSVESETDKESDSNQDQNKLLTICCYPDLVQVIDYTNMTVQVNRVHSGEYGDYTESEEDSSKGDVRVQPFESGAPVIKESVRQYSVRPLQAMPLRTRQLAPFSASIHHHPKKEHDHPTKVEQHLAMNQNFHHRKHALLHQIANKKAILARTNKANPKVLRCHSISTKECRRMYLALKRQRMNALNNHYKNLKLENGHHKTFFHHSHGPRSKSEASKSNRTKRGITKRKLDKKPQSRYLVKNKGAYEWSMDPDKYVPVPKDVKTHALEEMRDIIKSSDTEKHRKHSIFLDDSEGSKDKNFMREDQLIENKEESIRPDMRYLEWEDDRIHQSDMMPTLKFLVRGVDGRYREGSNSRGVHGGKHHHHHSRARFGVPGGLNSDTDEFLPSPRGRSSGVFSIDDDSDPSPSIPIRGLARQPSDDDYSETVVLETVTRPPKQQEEEPMKMPEVKASDEGPSPGYASSDVERSSSEEEMNKEPMHIANSRPEPVNMDNMSPDPSHKGNMDPGPAHKDDRNPGPAHMDDNHPGPTHIDEMHPGPTHIDEMHPGPTHMDEMRPGLTHMDIIHPGPTHMDDRHPGLAHMDDMHPGPGQMDDRHPGPAHMDDMHPGPSQIDDMHPGPDQMDGRHPGPAHMDDIQPGPTQMEDVHMEPPLPENLSLGRIHQHVPSPGLELNEPMRLRPIPREPLRQHMRDPAPMYRETLHYAVRHPEMINPHESHQQLMHPESVDEMVDNPGRLLPEPGYPGHIHQRPRPPGHKHKRPSHSGHDHGEPMHSEKAHHKPSRVKYGKPARTETSKKGSKSKKPVVISNRPSGVVKDITGGISDDKLRFYLVELYKALKRFFPKDALNNEKMYILNDEQFNKLLDHLKTDHKNSESEVLDIFNNLAVKSDKLNDDDKPVSLLEEIKLFDEMLKPSESLQETTTRLPLDLVEVTDAATNQTNVDTESSKDESNEFVVNVKEEADNENEGKEYSSFRELKAPEDDDLLDESTEKIGAFEEVETKEMIPVQSYSELLNKLAKVNQV